MGIESSALKKVPSSCLVRYVTLCWQLLLLLMLRCQTQNSAAECSLSAQVREACTESGQCYLES